MNFTPLATNVAPVAAVPLTADLYEYLVVGAVLFVLGALGFLTRRNLIVMMLSAEMMLHGVSINLAAFSHAHQNYQGQAFTIMILTVAACEAGLALSLILALYQRKKSLDVDLWGALGEAEPREPVEMAPPPPTAVPEFPRLTPAGQVPKFVEHEDAHQQETAGRV